MRQRGLDPLFYQVGPNYIPVQSGGMLLTAVDLQAEAGDVYKFQWTADCVDMLLVPVEIDLGLLGVAVGSDQASPQPLSTYLIASNGGI